MRIVVIGEDDEPCREHDAGRQRTSAARLCSPRDRDAAVERRDRAVQLAAALARTATTARGTTLAVASPFRAHQSLDAGERLAYSRAAPRPVAEVDDPPRRRAVGPLVEVLADRGRAGRPRRCADRPRASPGLFGREDETQAEDIRPLERAAEVGCEPLRLCPRRGCAPSMRGDPADLRAVELTVASPTVASRPDGRHLQVRATRPGLARDRAVDRPAVLTSWSRPTSRVSPWAIVLVAIRPKPPLGTKQLALLAGRSTRRGRRCRAPAASHLRGSRGTGCPALR